MRHSDVGRNRLRKLPLLLQFSMLLSCLNLIETLPPRLKTYSDAYRCVLTHGACVSEFVTAN